MSSSTDSLKKKVCVTVFLDELFEEVEDGSGPNRNEVSEVSQPELKLYGPPTLDLEEEVGGVSEVPLRPRPRKHRRESKFSKNVCESLSSEIERFEFGSSFLAETEKCETDETTFSDSDFDWEEYLEKTKGLDLNLNSEDGFPFRKNSREERISKLQSDSENLEKPKGETVVQRTVDTNRTRIRIIVAKNKSKSEEVNAGKTKPHQLKSILDEWTAAGEKIPNEDRHSDFLNETETENCSDSCISPREDRKYQTLKESRNDMSERIESKQNDSLLCYTYCVKECLNTENEDEKKDHRGATLKDNPTLSENEKTKNRSRERDLPDTLIETPRENNHARGDAIDEITTSASEFLGGLGSQEQLLACEEILKNAEEFGITTESPTETNYVAEFRFVKEGFSDGEDSRMTEIESEMIFADNRVRGESGIEDELPQTAFVKRLKTVEILASDGTDDAEDTSTEIVLVCENVMAEDVSAGAWLSSGSSWQGFCGATSQCFLKDSADSSMYLIEIPLRFAVP